jgi:tRNA uridine 5-carbamoylmethylation protein Kti12
MKSKKKICLMGLIGLPGAGKTSFCRAYAQHLARKKAEISLITVSLDDLIPLDQQAAAAAQPGTFKRWREQIAAAVEIHIGRINREADKMADGEVEAGSDKTCLNSTHIALRPLENTCSEGVVDRFESSGAQSSGTSLEYNEFVEKLNFGPLVHDRILIMIDDNSYLRSMRYPYYQMARRHSCGFCQLHLAAEVPTAIKLNQSREAGLRVEETVIRTMAEKLEPPDPLTNTWEMFSFSIPVMEGVELNLGMSSF